MWSIKRLTRPRVVPSKPKNFAPYAKIPDATPLPGPVAKWSSGWLGPSLYVKGDITSTDDLLIDGSVEGMIQLNERKLIVGAGAQVHADINARDVVVCGHVKGKVHATRGIEIKQEGSVIGHLRAAEIIIQDGADFRGSIEIDRNPIKKPDLDVLPFAASPAKEEVTENSSSSDAWTN